MKSLLERTSVRKYSTEPIKNEHIEALLQAAFSAPSARNAQPWHFYMITNKEMLEKLSNFSPYSSFLKEATLGIVVLADITDPINKDYMQQDCAAATQNILIQAKELGIGTCWLGAYPRLDRCEFVSKIINAPDNLQVLWVISCGYINEQTNKKEKWNSNKITYIK